MEKKEQSPKSQNHQDPKRKDQPDNNGRSPLNTYVKYTGLGFQMLVIIGIFVWAGTKLDERSANEKPVFTAILAVVGVIASLYITLKDIVKGRND